MPDTYYRELFYPFSPIFQMFYYLETGQLLKLVIEAHLFQGAHLQAIGSIWGTSNLWQATRLGLKRAAISLGLRKSQQRTNYPILLTPSFILQKLPLRQALSCHFTCKCDALNWSNFHNSGSSWLWLVGLDWRPASHCLPATKCSLGPVGSPVLIKTTGSCYTGAGVAPAALSPARCPHPLLTPPPPPSPLTASLPCTQPGNLQSNCLRTLVKQSWWPQSLQLIRRHPTVVNSFHL